MAQRRQKAIFVAEVVYNDQTTTPKDLLENAPTWFDCALGPEAAVKEQRDGSPLQYHFEDPTLYLSLDDFDADRAGQLDHFRDNDQALWVEQAKHAPTEVKSVGHTPGPWSVTDIPGELGSYFNVESGDSENDGWVVARVWADVPELLPYADANARLIAAAPEMYEALRVILDCWSSEGELTDKVVAIGLNAIAKAEGR